MTQADHDASTDYDPERHDEGAGAVAWGCACFCFWIVIGLAWMLKGLIR